MDKELVLNLIKEAEKTENINISAEIAVAKDATLYLFECDDIYAAAIGYDDGTLFVMSDWQEPSRPTTSEEVGIYNWRRIDGKEAVIVSGLPRVLAE